MLCLSPTSINYIPVTYYSCSVLIFLKCRVYMQPSIDFLLSIQCVVTSFLLLFWLLFNLLVCGLCKHILIILKGSFHHCSLSKEGLK